MVFRVCKYGDMENDCLMEGEFFFDYDGFERWYMVICVLNELEVIGSKFYMFFIVRRRVFVF